MAIILNTVKLNKAPITTSFKQKEVKSYLDANGAVDTTDLVKPLPPNGHLVKDNFGNSIKYFFKDIGYDFKAIKDGFTGKANDHQLGRLNDVGLRLGGIGIAIYLASKTKSPKARLMEYIGLATFLTAMALYPKLAINTPARLKHGFDIDKEYIDDQGRKKSVFQDSNYVPYEMYTSSEEEYTTEDLDKIGDKMGIPRDIVNRHSVIKEQMRKIATQNNTLWMLTAGFATPALTALGCYGLENYLVAPGLEKARNNKINNLISTMLQQTEKMTTEATSNKLSDEVKSILNNFINKEIPENEIENIIKKLTKNLDVITEKGIKEDVINLIKNPVNGGNEFFNITEESLEDILNSFKHSKKINIPQSKKDVIIETLKPTKEELLNVLKELSNETSSNGNIRIKISSENELRTKIITLFESKLQNLKDVPVGFSKALPNKFAEAVMDNLEINKSTVLSKETAEKLIDFSKIIGEFKENLLKLDHCKSVKFEHTEETMLARASEKIQKILLKEFNISFKEMKLMRESSDYTKKVIEQKLEEICKDENRYKKIIGKIGKAIEDYEITLNGKFEDKSYVLDLINAFEHNFNNTAKRLHKLDKEAFKSTIDKLVKEAPDKLELTVKSREELFNFLDGLIYEYKLNADRSNFSEYIAKQSKGVGSSKNLYINRILSRYQSNKNIYHRLLHSLEIFKRANNPAEFSNTLNNKTDNYIQTVIKLIKDTVLEATTKDHTLKLNLINNEILYKDVFNNMFKIELEKEIFSKGYVTDTAKEVLGKNNNLANGNVLERFQFYLSKFKNLVGNLTTDFTKPNHILDPNKAAMYHSSSKTNSAIYNLVGQSPVEFFKDAAKNRYGTRKWLNIAGAITGSVVGITVLAQLLFGKLNNPQNLKKQVQNDTNK